MSQRTMILLGGAAVGIVVVVALLAFLIGMSVGGGGQEAAESADDEKQKTSPPAETTQSKQRPPSKTAPRMSGTAQVGETAEMLDRSYNVNDIQRGWVFRHNIPKPDAGNEFVIVNLPITNQTDQPIKVNVWDFESEDSSGVRRKGHATTQVPNAIPPSGATVTPNGEFTGNLAVEFSQDDPNFKLVYRPIY